MVKKTYCITYRDEFSTDIEAESREEAIAKFKKSKTIEVSGELWPEYFEVEEFELVEAGE